MANKKSFILFCILLSMVGNKTLAYDFAVENSEGKTIYYNYINSGSELEVAYGYYDGKIVIPDNVTYMNRTRKVTSIGKEAFTRSDNLEVIIPNSVKTIGDAAFSGTDLTSITIPSSVTDIGERAFRCCNSLISMIVEKDNPTFDSRDNCNAIIQTSNNKLIFGCEKTKIPNSVSVIGKEAFVHCRRLTNIIIPNSVFRIEERAFDWCAFESLTIGNGILELEQHAFVDCETEKLIIKDIAAWCKITFNGTTSNPICRAKHLYSDDNTIISSLTIPDGVTKINSYAFYGVNLTSITFPNSLTRIEEHAFSYSKILSVNIPNSVVAIGKNVFEGCHNLTTASIGDNVKRIDDNAFYCCFNLNSVSISNGITSIGKKAFGSCYSLTSIIIPNTTQHIDEEAFVGCMALKSVNIPNNVLSIGDRAFGGCSGISSLTIGCSVKSIEEFAFDGADIVTIVSLIENPTRIEGRKGYRTFSENTFLNATLYVPIGTIYAYKEQEGWKDFVYIEEGAPAAIDAHHRESKDKAIYYNINGQKENTPKRGLYIKNGKKIIFR